MNVTIIEYSKYPRVILSEAAQSNKSVISGLCRRRHYFALVARISNVTITKSRNEKPRLTCDY